MVVYRSHFKTGSLFSLVCLITGHQESIQNCQYQHMPRTAAFTLENLARKTECIFEKYMVRGTFWHKNRNRTYSRLREKFSFWFLALTLESMFSVIALDPDGRLKKFLCLNNFSFNFRTSFAFANIR